MVLELNTSVDCYGVHFHVRSYVCLFKRLLRTVIVYERKIVADVDHPYEDGSQMERQLAEQHWRLVSELRAGHLHLQARRGDDRPTGIHAWRGLLVNVWRAAVDCLPAMQWRLAVPARSRRITLLSWLFATSSWAAAGLSVQTELGLGGSGTTEIRVAGAVSTVEHGPPGPAGEAERLGDRGASPRLAAVEMTPAPVDRPRPAADSAPSMVRPVPPVRPQPVPSAPRPAARRAAPASAPPAIRVQVLKPEPAPGVPAEKPVTVIATQPGQLIDLADVDLAPRPSRRKLPDYTRRAVKKKQQGRVALKLLIDERGRIVDLRLLRTIADSDLNEAAIEAAWRWRFEPAHKDGVPVRVWKPVTVVFARQFGELRVFLLE